MPTDFHEVRFPLDVSLGSRGGPQRRTEIVTLASGREHRNARLAHSRRRYDAGLGVRTLLAWGQRAQRGLPHAVESRGASGHRSLVR